MKNTWLRFALATAVSGGMLVAAAQEVHSQPAQPAPATQQHRQFHRGARFAQYLELTPAQRTEAKTIFQSARQTAMPVRQEMKQVRTEMFQAVRANDKAKIDQLSAREGKLQGQLFAIRHEAFAKLYSNLTPAQRAKADQLPAHFRQMRQ